MILQKIYKKAVTGKIQEWEIEVVGNSYRTIAGQQDGKKVISKWTVVKEGKNLGKSNATTAEEQALKEAIAKRTKKLEGEYTEVLDNAGQLSFIKPMLAYEVDLDKLVYPVYSQPKLDGIRSISTKETFKSRTGKPIFGVPHIILALQPFLAKYTELPFDGELYNHDLRDQFEEIASIVNKKDPSTEELLLSQQQIQYWIYDVVDDSKVFKERLSILQELDKLLKKNKYIHIVPTDIAENRQQLDALYNKYIKEGYEGQIIRLNDVYRHQRTNSLLKRKEFQDAEFEVLDIQEGRGNKSEMAGFVIARTKDGKEFKASLLGTASYLKGILKAKKKYKTATIKFFRYTTYGIPKWGVVKAFNRNE